jgi:hypothetical protein
MDKRFQKKLLVALIAGMLMPLAASAADADLMNKIEAMSRELEALKAQVKANEVKSAQTAEQVKAVAAKTESTEVAELKSQVTRLEEKSLSKWLTIGGDYRFRYDYLEGESKTFTDVNATFANAQTSLQTAMLTDTTGTAATYLAGLAQFSSAMMGIQTYDQAVAFQPMVDGMMPALGAYAVTVPAYKPKNSSLYSNRFNLNLNAKATQDVSLTADLAMYKVFGSKSDGAITNSGSAPFFADRVGVFDGTLSRGAVGY